MRAYKAWDEVASQALRQHRLSPAGREALAVLEGAGTPLSPTTIAERLLVTTASVTSLLDTLEKRGFLARSPDPDDRRKLLVTLTAAGQDVVDAFLPQVVAVQTALVEGLSEPRRRELLKALTEIRTTAETLDTEAVVDRAEPRRPAR